jgi:acylphosphatase
VSTPDNESVPDRARAHIYVSGMVQGVSYRWYATQHARTREIGGWIRNLPDGRVEAVFEGPKPAVEELIAWCREGPRYARVSDVEVEWEEPEGVYEFDLEF